MEISYSSIEKTHTIRLDKFSELGKMPRDFEFKIKNNSEFRIFHKGVLILNENCN